MKRPDPTLPANRERVAQALANEPPRQPLFATGIGPALSDKPTRTAAPGEVTIELDAPGVTVADLAPIIDEQARQDSAMDEALEFARLIGRDDDRDQEPRRKTGLSVLDEMKGDIGDALYDRIRADPAALNLLLDSYRKGYDPPATKKKPDPYLADERVALLKCAPSLKNIPEADKPAVAAALREIADGLDPDDRLRERTLAYEQAIGESEREHRHERAVLEQKTHELREERNAALARVRELEQQIAANWGQPTTETP